MAKTHDHDPNELIEAAYGATETTYTGFDIQLHHSQIQFWRATRPFGDAEHNFQNPDSKILNDELLEIFVWV